MTPRRVTTTLFITSFLLVGSLFAALTYVPMTARAAILYVGGIGPGNYTTIQAAIDAASPGDKIYVFNGTYNENVVVNKTLSLAGQTRNATIVDGGVGDAIRVVADWVNISWFTVTTAPGGGPDKAGVKLNHVDFCTISDNDFRNSVNGLYLDSSHLNTIVDNNVSGTAFGFQFYRSSGNTIGRNNVSDVYNGVSLWDSDANVVVENRITRAVGFPNGKYRSAGIYQYHSNSNSVTRNKITNSDVGVFVWSSSYGNISDNDIFGNSGGIHLYYGWDTPFASSHNTVGWNNVSNNGHGISIDAATRNAVSHNTIASNAGSGIYDLSGIANVFNDNIISNNGDGVWLSSAWADTVANNTVKNNNNGIRFTFSTGVDQNSFYHNSIINNTNQAYDSGGNSWDDGYPSGGNYWSDYNGTDNYNGPGQNLPGSDGIGDTPYNVSGGTNRDRYPLMPPSGPSLLPDLVISPANVSFFPVPPFKQDSFASIDVTIQNLGPAASGPTVVRFYDGVPPSPRIGADQPLVQILAGGAANVSVTWTPLVAGGHDICVVVDPDNLIAEINETNNTACVRVDVTFALNLTPGHRFISFPAVVADDTIESVLSSISGCYDYVRWYDSLDAASHWKSYVPGRSHESLLRLDNTMGFWINITSTCSFAPGGTRPLSTMITLHQGWNMVGFPSFNTTYTVTDLKASIGLTSVIVEAFDSSAAPYYLQRVSDGYLMGAGEGYWIYVPADAIWIVDG